MNENINVAIKQFANYLDGHPNEAFSVGEKIFIISKEYDCAPRDVFKEIVRRLRE